jgi:hypothetical protein
LLQLLLLPLLLLLEVVQHLSLMWPHQQLAHSAVAAAPHPALLLLLPLVAVAMLLLLLLPSCSCLCWRPRLVHAAVPRAQAGCRQRSTPAVCHAPS